MKHRHLFSVALIVFLSSNASGAFTPANRPIDAIHYTITLEIDPSKDPKEFSAAAEVKLKALEPLTEFTLDIDSLNISYVQLNRPAKSPAVFEVKDGKSVKVTLPRAVKKGETFSVNFAYTGAIGTAHSGVFKVTDPDEPGRGPLIFTHFEPLRARAFFPSNDEPYDKAITEIRATVPARYEVLSNGKKTKDRKFKRDGAPWREVHWQMEKPHSTYLVSLAIGPFAKISKLHDRKEISVWVGETKTKNAEYALDITKKAVEFFEQYLGVKYPWSKYATIGLPTFLWGGMENTSSTHMNQERTVLNDPNSSFEKKRIMGLAAHELAHQWFGDYATMKWWDDIWLNESFANHMGTLATKNNFKNEEAELEVVVDTWEDYFRQEDGPRSHPIVDTALTNPDDAFDSISYTKGENVLRMLSFYVGEANFKKGLKTYLTTYAFSNGTYLDFFSSVEKASGVDLSQFRDTWLLQRGYPVISYGGTWDAKNSAYTLNLAQKSNHANDRSIFHFRLPVVFHRKSTPSYSKAIAVTMDGPRLAQKVQLLAEPEWVTINPGGVVLGKVKQEVLKEEVLTAQALGDDDVIARTWASLELLSALKEEKPMSAYAEKSLVQILGADPSPYVRNSILSVIQSMKTQWLPDQMGEAIVKFTQGVLSSGFEKSALFVSDPHGWRQWRSELLGTLGKVKRPEVLPLLAAALGKSTLGLDDLQEASFAVATLGNERSADLLKTALKLHEHRGYRFRYVIQYAFGALATPAAANEIRELAKTCGSDLIGRMGWVIRDNQALKNSPEWASFLKDFILSDTRFGDEVKARILQTVEDVKTKDVRGLLETIVKQSASERLKEVSKKILDKNFTG